mgnify:CR=1 FL=1
MELSTYFRINAQNTGQFERTLIIADKGSYVSYLEGCTAPQRDIAQLHAAVVEIIIEEDAEEPGTYHPVTGTYPMVQVQAFFNWVGLVEDRSAGIHNPDYVNALLDNTIAALAD